MNLLKAIRQLLILSAIVLICMAPLDEAKSLHQKRQKIHEKHKRKDFMFQLRHSPIVIAGILAGLANAHGRMPHPITKPAVNPIYVPVPVINVPSDHPPPSHHHHHLFG